MESRFTRRQFLRVAGLTGSVVAMAACAAPAPQQPAGAATSAPQAEEPAAAAPGAAAPDVRYAMWDWYASA